MDVWKGILSCIREKIDAQTFDTWFKPIQVESVGDDEIRLKVPNEYFKSWLLEHYQPLIDAALTELKLEGRRVTFLHEGDAQPQAIESPGEEPLLGDLPDKSALNPKYTFESFVIGSCNQLAHAASRAVADRPSRAYNPLFIYGGVGLGKTHLIQAVGHLIRAKHKKLRVAYISAEHFMNELVAAIRYGKTEEFRDRYRSIDVLLMDDIQFMTGKERTQEEFFHTFNALYNAERQIMITCDCAPREIPGLEERLRSRFEWGLIADLKPPEYETKIAILKKKAEMERMEIPDEVIDFIARNIKSNIRELEAALIRLIAYASLEGIEIDLPYAKIVLKNIVTNGRQAVSPDMVLKAVADYFNLKPSQLKAKSNAKYIAEPRQIAMYICKELTGYSLPQIGKEFGNKHHTTVLHAIRKVEQLMRENRDFHNIVHKIIGSLE